MAKPCPPMKMPDVVDDDLTLYDVLEVHHDADTKTITQQHRRQALRWHPDKHHQKDRTTAQKHFLRVQEAYEVLTSERLRPLYDSYLDGIYSGEIASEMAWTEFRQQAENSTDLATGESVAEQIIRTKKERMERSAAPSLDDLRLLGYASAGALLGGYFVYKLFLEEQLWLASAPFWQSLEWAESTLPLSFDFSNMIAMKRISAQLSALVKWSASLNPGGYDVGGGFAAAGAGAETGGTDGAADPGALFGRLAHTSSLARCSSLFSAVGSSAGRKLLKEAVQQADERNGFGNGSNTGQGQPAIAAAQALVQRVCLPYLGPFQAWLRLQAVLAERVLVKNFSTLEGYLWMGV